MATAIFYDADATKTPRTDVDHPRTSPLHAVSYPTVMPRSCENQHTSWRMYDVARTIDMSAWRWYLFGCPRVRYEPPCDPMQALRTLGGVVAQARRCGFHQCGAVELPALIVGSENLRLCLSTILQATCGKRGRRRSYVSSLLYLRILTVIYLVFVMGLSPGSGNDSSLHHTGPGSRLVFGAALYRDSRIPDWRCKYNSPNDINPTSPHIAMGSRDIT